MKIQWLLVLCLMFFNNVYGQELEARAYSNLPKNMNAVAFAYSFTKGSVAADAALPIEDFTIKAHSIAARYVRTFGVAGKLARVHVVVPYVTMDGQAKIRSQDTSAERLGLGDMRVHLGINLIGSPALDRKDFVKYSQKTIVGVSLATSFPTGKYYNDKRLNIGNHRWGFKPEIGFSKRFKQVYIDGYVGTWFFTINEDYLKTKALKQQPLLTTQLHASYYFKSGMLVGINGNWYRGGKKYIDDAPFGGLIDHRRLGITWAMPFGGKHLIKVQGHTSVFTDPEARFYLIGLGYQYVFF